MKDATSYRFRRLAPAFVAAVIALAAGIATAQDFPTDEKTDPKSAAEAEDAAGGTDAPGDKPESAPDDGVDADPESDSNADSEAGRELKEDAEPEPSPGKNSIPDVDGERLIREKMRVFRAYEGEWEGVQAYAEAEGNAAFESKGEWTGRFLLGAMYFEMEGFSEYASGRSSYRWMITYDVVLEKYRAWTFNSNGVVTDWIARHDPEQKEIIWRFVDARTGIHGWLRTQTQPNVVTGHGMAKTEGARVLSDYRLNFKRKKLRI